MRAGTAQTKGAMAEVRAGTAHAILALFAIAEAVNALYVGLFFWAEPASYAPAPAYAARDLIQRLAPAWIRIQAGPCRSCNERSCR